MDGLKIASDLEKEFKKDNPEFIIEVVDVKDYNKQLFDKTFYAKYTYRSK